MIDMLEWKEVQSPVKVEGKKPSVRLAERPGEETRLIAVAALCHSNNDVNEAKRLIRKTTFRYFGRTWGESLFVAKNEKELSDLGMVVGNMVFIAEADPKTWINEVVSGSIKEMMKSPANVPLYIAQIEDLTGAEGLATFRLTARVIGIPMPNIKMQELENALYKKIAGLSYWEMDLEALTVFLFSAHKMWQELMESYDTASDSMKEWMKSIMVESRLSLRELVRVMLGRNLIHSGEDIKMAGKRLFYEDILHFLD